jgi:hypothetical protein
LFDKNPALTSRAITMVWPVIMAAARTYAPYITFPFALVIGFVGYNIEGWARGGKSTPYREEGVKDSRSERLAEMVHDRDMTQVDTLKEHKFVPKTVLGRNG